MFLGLQSQHALTIEIIDNAFYRESKLIQPFIAVEIICKYYFSKKYNYGILAR